MPEALALFSALLIARDSSSLALFLPARLSEKKEDVPKPLFSLSSKSSAISREEMMDDGNEHRGQGEPGTFAASAKKTYEVKGK